VTPLPLRIGFVGCGRAAASLHLPAVARTPGVEAVAVADAEPAVARAVAARFGIERTYASAQELAADDAVDLVAVCTPPRAHAAAALAALEAGRHVFVEKPLAIDPAEADAMVEAAEASGRVAITGFNLRVHRQVRLVREALDRGDLGRLLMVRTHWASGPRPAGWRSDPADGGVALWEMGSHHLDLWRYLAGEPEDLRATGHQGVVALAGRTADGVVLSSTLVDGTSDANDVELVGDRGRLTATLYHGDGPHRAPLGVQAAGPAQRLRAAADRARVLPRMVRDARAGGDFHLGYVAEWEAVRAAVRDGAPPHATFEDGRVALDLVLRARAALAAPAGAVT
jgi:predicted dehydrogenase